MDFQYIGQIAEHLQQYHQTYIAIGLKVPAYICLGILTHMTIKTRQSIENVVNRVEKIEETIKEIKEINFKSVA